MKHIFFVHSHICYAISVAVIGQEKIAMEDIVFVTDRSYNPPESRWKTLPSPPNEWFTLEKNVFLGWKKMRKFENYVEAITAGKFHFYYPHTLNIFSNFMADHRNCYRHHLIEEGTASYLTTSEINLIHPPLVLNWKHRIWSKVFYRGHFHGLSFYRDDQSRAYCSSALAFPGKRGKVVLNLNFQDIFQSQNIQNLQAVLVLDSSVETKYAEPENYMIGIQRLIEKLQEKHHQHQILYVKLHPYQHVKRNFADKVLKKLRAALDNISVQELPQDTAIEAITWRHGTRLYLGVSSLSVYAKRNGGECYSFAQKIAKADARYALRLRQQPKVFLDSVTFI